MLNDCTVFAAIQVTNLRSSDCFSSSPSWVQVADRSAAGITPAAGMLDFDSVVTVVVDVIAATASAGPVLRLRCRRAS